MFSQVSTIKKDILAASSPRDLVWTLKMPPQCLQHSQACLSMREHVSLVPPATQEGETTLSESRPLPFRPLFSLLGFPVTRLVHVVLY